MAFEMQTKKQQVKIKPTQSFLKFSEIKNDTIVAQDGTLRAIVSVTSTNFDLKSEEEQNAIIGSFQNFLNSLEFPVQILMQSRKMDIAGYLDKLKRMAEKQVNELLKVQTEEYVNFIKQLIENASIMNKDFYIVIPLSKTATSVSKGMFSGLFGGNKAKMSADQLANFKRNKEELDNRANSIMGSLGGMGVKGQRLTTSEIIKLLYNSYNFDSGPAIDPAQLKDIKVMENQTQ